ncbi:MAG: hypothetical protein Q8M22_15885 [Actinomycetota bacterium]|nr:hypothetical protein [Actinomycetota bacterium]
MRRSLLLVVIAAVSCSSGGEAAPEASVPDTAPSPTAIGVEGRIGELERFAPSATLAGEQCGDLSVSNGTVQLDASGSMLARAIQRDTRVSPTELHLEVRFGSGFPSFTCTDQESELHHAVVEETWPASATSGTFTVVAGPLCSSATLRLADVVATSPAGHEVPLGDIAITNPAWQWWHPFECHLLDDPPGV